MSEITLQLLFDEELAITFPVGPRGGWDELESANCTQVGGFDGETIATICCTTAMDGTMSAAVVVAHAGGRLDVDRFDGPWPQVLARLAAHMTTVCAQ